MCLRERVHSYTKCLELGGSPPAQAKPLAATPGYSPRTLLAQSECGVLLHPLPGLCMCCSRAGDTPPSIPSTWPPPLHPSALCSSGLKDWAHLSDAVMGHHSQV